MSRLESRIERSVRWLCAAVLCTGATACTNAIGGVGDGEDLPPETPDGDRSYPRDDAGRPPPTGRDGGTNSGDDAVTPPPESDSGATDAVAPPADAVPPPSGGCYSEAYTKDSLADLKSGYSSSKWLSTSLEVLKRRFGFGNAILEAEKSDPQLAGFKDSSSWGALMESMDTMCHEETHGWDFDTALSLSGKHAYHMRVDLVIEPPKFSDFFARNELLSYITDSATSLYDSTYLKGEQGTYDFIFLGDELTAYTNGLACVTALGDQISTYGTSFRDGAAAHILYLEWYLNRARTAHPTVYAKMKADPQWMKFVRFSWARVHFWTEASKPYPTFGIKDAEIWVKVNKAENIGEIEKFTGESPASVACKP